MQLHPGPRIDRIPAKGGAGLVFVLTILAIVLIGVPAARIFLAGAAAVGLLVAAALRLARKA
jgi:hypothetical protein